MKPTFISAVFSLNRDGDNMPQVTCPNCGMTINLKNRKEIDVNLIKSAAKAPRTFTELLQVTRLPRKTLSLRLKELCVSGAIVKGDGMYKLNGVSEFWSDGGKSMGRLSGAFRDRRMRTGLMLIALVLFSSASGHVLAMLFPPPHIQTYQEPVIMGNFTMDLDIHNVEGLFGWQVVVIFNSSVLKVLEVSPGGFLAFNDPKYPQDPRLLLDVYESRLLLGSCLYGDMPGKDGSGRLATIVFGYLTENYDAPKIVPEEVFKTLLLDSQGKPIPIKDSTLTLTIVGKP